jgi:FkbM family methyltransferase
MAGTRTDGTPEDWLLSSAAPRLRRFGDLASKAWAYMLGSLEQPKTLPFLLVSAANGVHLGQLIRLNRHRRWIQSAGIRTIIDVGANTGQFSSAVAALVPDARIYAFEPLPDCFANLSRRLKKRTNFRAFMVALGDRPGESVFWRSSFSESSSLLTMTKLHEDSFPWSAVHTPESVTVRTLDSYLPQLKLDARVFLKLDVQGFEARVLRGAERMLAHVHYVLAEASFYPLYEGQDSFEDIHRFLSDHGFEYKGSMDQLPSPTDGSILEADALFIRK